MDLNVLNFLNVKFVSKSHIRISHQNLIDKVLLIGITYLFTILKLNTFFTRNAASDEKNPITKLINKI